MSKGFSDRIKNFDELDPGQFAEMTDKTTELAGELSRQRLTQGALGLEGAVDADGRRIPRFGEIASQLPDVHREIRKARSAIPELESRGDTEAARHMRDYLDRLRTERDEVLEAMADRVTPIKRTGQWRFIDKSPADIRRALVNLAGFKEAAAQLERENPDIGQQASFVLLDELTLLIRDGRLPVPRDFWRRQVLDKPVLAEEEKPTEGLSDPSVSSYSGNSSKNEGKNNMSTPERMSDDESRAAGNSGNELSEELRELIPDSATPRSPLEGERSTSVDSVSAGQRHQERVQDFIRRQHAESGPGVASSSETRLPDDYEHTISGVKFNNADLKRRLAGGQKINLPDSPGSGTMISLNERGEVQVMAYDSFIDGEDGATSSRAERTRSSSETDTVESRMTAEFGDQTFERGDKVLYESDNGNLAEYYVLCNSIDDPPGLVVQSAENEALVFAIGADTEAHRVRRINSIEESPRPPEGGGGTSERPGPPEGTPPGEVERTVEVPPHIIESIPRVPSQADLLEAGASLRNPVDAAIQAVARAKEEREKLFGRAASRVERLNQSRGNLETAYANYMSGWANLLAEYSSTADRIGETKDGFQSEIDVRQEEIARIQETDLPEGVKDIQIREQQIQIDIHQAAIQECDRRIQEVQETRERVLAQVEAQMMYEMAETRLDIESSQAEQNAGTLVGRFKNMWRRHPVARMAIGVGLAATGFLVGGPIGSAAMVAGVGMRGFGGYMGTEGGVNKFREWRAGKASTREAEAANAGTSLAARAQGERHVGNALIEGVRGDRLAAQNEFMQRHAQELYGEQMLRGVLNGDSAAAGDVASMLLSDQLDRTVEDARWKRGAKLGGAAVGTALAALGLLRNFDTGKPKVDTTKPPPGETPHPSPPEGPPTAPPGDYDPRIPRMAGIHEVDPNAAENWQNMHEWAAANPAAAAVEAANQQAFDRVYEAASAGMPKPQLDQLNQIIGMGSKAFGTEKVADMMPALANNVRSGMSTERILELYGLPKPPVS